MESAAAHETPGAVAVSPPSFGPATVPYVPPLSLEDAILQARVAVRQRQKRGAKLGIAAVAVLIIPLIVVLVPFFPSDASRAPPAEAYLPLLVVAGDFLAACLGVYWVLADRSIAAWLLLAGGLAVGAYYAYAVDVQVVPMLNAELPILLGALFIPLVALLGAALEVLGGLIARPRPVRFSEPT